MVVQRRTLRGVPLGLAMGYQVFRGLEGVWKQREVHLRPRETHPVTRDQATSSITGGAVSTCAGFPNALPLRSWITWQARSSSGKCADEGNACLRASTSAEAGLPPSVQAARTRKAVSTSSLGLMVVSDLHLILGLNVCFCTWANSPMVPIHLVRVVDAWHEHRAMRRTAQSCRRRPGGGHAVAGEAGHGSDHREGRH